MSRSTDIIGIIRGTHRATPKALLGKPVFVSCLPSEQPPRGTIPIHVEGGGRFDVGGVESSYFVGGYFGPRYELDLDKVGIAFQSHELGAHYNFNVEHWFWDDQDYPNTERSFDTDDVRKTAKRFVYFINAFRRARPDMRFSIYGLPHNAAFTARNRMPIDGWKRANDLMRPAIEACDYVTPSLYTIADWTDDESHRDFTKRYIDMTIAESRRVAGGRAVVPFLMAPFHDSVKREPTNVPLEQFAPSVNRIMQQSDGAIFWAYNWATKDQAGHLNVVMEAAIK